MSKYEPDNQSDGRLAPSSQRRSSPAPLLPSEILTELHRQVPVTPPTLARLKTWLKSDDARLVAKVVLVLMGVNSGQPPIRASWTRGRFVSLVEPWLGGNRYRSQRVIRRLRRLKLVRVVTLPDGSGRIELTRKGRRYALRAHLDALDLHQSTRWDRKWRMVIFDVPEKHRVARDVLREKLRELGFVAIQRSVWLLPWVCEAELYLVRERFDLLDNMLILTVPDSNEFDQWRDRFFNRRWKPSDSTP